jgi:hypothetical protein
MKVFVAILFHKPHLAMVNLSMQIYQKEYLGCVHVLPIPISILKFPYPPFISCITSIIFTRSTFNLRIPFLVYIQFLILVDFGWLVAYVFSYEYMWEYE